MQFSCFLLLNFFKNVNGNTKTVLLPKCKNCYCPTLLFKHLDFLFYSALLKTYRICKEVFFLSIDYTIKHWVEMER